MSQAVEKCQFWLLYLGPLPKGQAHSLGVQVAQDLYLDSPGENGGAMQTFSTESKRKKKIKKIISALTFIVGMVTLSNTGYAAMAFPNVGTARDTQEMLKRYQVYLEFVVQIGRTSDLASTQRMEAKFAELKRRNPEGAARFLKGLRFELLDKAQRLGKQETILNTQNAELIRWVGRFMGQWAREADEHLYRVYSSQLAKK